MCLVVSKIYIFFKLKQDFLQTGRNILLIQIMNDSSDDTNIKVIPSFPNRTFALRVFPSSITFPAETIFLTEFLLTLVAAAVFAITAPALNCGLFPLLLSS